MNGFELINQWLTPAAGDRSFSFYLATACFCLIMYVFSVAFPLVKNKQNRKLEAIFWGLFTLLSLNSLYFELGHPMDERFVSFVLQIFIIFSCFIMLIVQTFWYWCIAYSLLAVFVGSLAILASRVGGLYFDKEQVVGLNFVAGSVVALVGGYINFCKRKKNPKVYSAFVGCCLSLQTGLRLILAFQAGAMGALVGVLSALVAVYLVRRVAFRQSVQSKKTQRQSKAKRD
jgi:hypothetical protein